MKVITLEEHHLDPDIARAGAATARMLTPHFAEAFVAPTDQLLDLDEGRIADMDRYGVTTQVLSTIGAQYLPANVAVELTVAANDTLAAAVRRHPGRYAAFAALPTAVPDAAARELGRCVEELGAVGTLIFGRTDGEFLSAERFDPILRAAARLSVPIYLHPYPAPREVNEANYRDLDLVVQARLQTAAWGWHAETAVHFLQLVLSGALDRYPDLQIILGHWGEMIPFWLDRLDEMLPPGVTGLERTIGDYVRQNVYLTPSGMFSRAQLRYCVDVVGADRIMYSVDYPFISQASAVDFLASADLPEADKENIAYRTAERVLGL